MESDIVIQPLAFLTVIGQVISAVLIIVLLLQKFSPKNKLQKQISSLISQNYIPIILVISAIATLGSLSFSEILGFVPCKLCWYQRIFMYPLLIISGIALLKNDTNVKKYILSLSVVGFLIAFYHILLQTFPAALECSDEVAKCSAKEFATFGYVTIPVMAATAFLMIILFSIVSSKKK